MNAAESVRSRPVAPNRQSELDRHWFLRERREPTARSSSLVTTNRQHTHTHGHPACLALGRLNLVLVVHVSPKVRNMIIRLKQCGGITRETSSHPHLPDPFLFCPFVSRARTCLRRSYATLLERRRESVGGWGQQKTPWWRRHCCRLD